MQAGVDKSEAAGFLGMSVEMLDRIYGHHDPDHLWTAAHAIGYRRVQSLPITLPAEGSCAHKPLKTGQLLELAIIIGFSSTAAGIAALSGLEGHRLLCLALNVPQCETEAAGWQVERVVSTRTSAPDRGTKWMRRNSLVLRRPPGLTQRRSGQHDGCRGGARSV
jgi:hypothetical protein